jgi:nitroimidazol reductase NimA-like FMN-containing flavoprotein (pyridoxamine 5'-phosphate oxidase superfamily)
MTGHPRSTVRRMPERGKYDAETIHAILDEGFLCHAGFCVEGQPFVIPTLYGRAGDVLYLHGSAASRTLRELGRGVEACIAVTLVDGLVLARSGYHSSMNYRSVTAFGSARLVEGEAEKAAALKVLSDHLLRGRWEEIRPPSPQELKATSVLEFRIAEAAAKVRTGGPNDDAEDYALPVWAGVLPVALRAGAPVPDGRLPAGTPAPDYLNAWRR